LQSLNSIPAQKLALKIGFELGLNWVCSSNIILLSITYNIKGGQFLLFFSGLFPSTHACASERRILDRSLNRILRGATRDAASRKAGQKAGDSALQNRNFLFSWQAI
jgi:hypothetical protein